MEKAPKPSTLKAVDFTTAIRVSKSYLKTRVYQDGLGEQVVELYSEFLVHWSKSIAFPELVLPIIFMLRKWLKRVSDRATGNKNLRLNSTLTLLVQKLEANASWIEERRAKVTFAPNDREGVNGFLADTEWDSTPLGVFVANQRKLREQRRRDKEAVRDDQ